MAEEEQHSIELGKTYFELFKHLSTLNLAAAIGVVAIGELDLADIETTSSALLAFLASFLLSVVGLERSIDALRRDHTNLTTPYDLSIWSIAFLFVGVANLALDIAQVSELVQWLLLLAAVAGALVNSYRQRKFRR